MPGFVKWAAAAAVVAVVGGLAFVVLQPKTALPAVGVASASAVPPSPVLTSSQPTTAPTSASTAAPSAAVANGKAIAVAAGYHHSCAITKVGGVKCWGVNEYGELGNGTIVDSSVALDVSGLADGVTSIAAGGAVTCASKQAGGVLCWGWNGSGRLAIGSTNPALSATPLAVVDLASSVTAIAAGFTDVCALTSAGGVKCWGDNGYGELGNGSAVIDSTRPVDVTGLSGGVRAIAAGDSHVCAVTAAGGAVCWGANNHGQLGNATKSNSGTPSAVSGLAGGVRAVTAGSAHTCALTTGGGVKCWGANDSGQLGNGSTVESATPVDVTGLASGVIAIAAGENHTCALTSAGGVKCWGANAYAGSVNVPTAAGGGQLGNGSMVSSKVPVDVLGLASGVIAIAAGGVHSCALTQAGDVLCWGATGHGEMNNPGSTESLVPVAVKGLQ